MQTPPSKFRRDSYSESNQLGIDLITRFLVRRGFDVPNRPEDYKVDIHAYKEGKKYLIEAEVRRGLHFTSQETFPFDTVSFLARKKKYQLDQPFWYFLVCRETQYCLFANSKDIFQERHKVVKRINTTRRSGMDTVYHVPLSKCQFRNLNEQSKFTPKVSATI